MNIVICIIAIYSTHPSYLNRVPELCLHVWLVLKKESYVLYNSPETGLVSSEGMIEVEQFGYREVKQLLVFFSQCYHFFLPGHQ